jgi:hypothetical protein
MMLPSRTKLVDHQLGIKLPRLLLTNQINEESAVKRYRSLIVNLMQLVVGCAGLLHRSLRHLHANA